MEQPSARTCNRSKRLNLRRRQLIKAVKKETLFQNAIQWFGEAQPTVETKREAPVQNHVGSTERVGGMRAEVYYKRPIPLCPAKTLLPERGKRKDEMGKRGGEDRSKVTKANFCCRRKGK